MKREEEEEGEMAAQRSREATNGALANIVEPTEITLRVGMTDPTDPPRRKPMAD